MSTEKQREANRRNAQFSSGPKTPEGKAASARNAFKHGFCADDATLHHDPETSQEISARVTRYLDHFLPQSPSKKLPPAKSPSAKSASSTSSAPKPDSSTSTAN